MKYEKLGNIKTKYPIYKLEDLCEIQIGKTPRRDNSKYWGTGYKWASISDMKSPVLTETKEQITELAIKECNCRLIPKDTLLMSFKLSIGKLAFTGTDLYMNEAICALFIKDSKKLINGYLFYILKNVPLLGSNVAVKGSTLNKESLKKIKIPLPPMSEQIRIANILSKAEELISERKQSIKLLNDYLKSVFLEMFGDPVKNEKGWEMKKLGDICCKIGSGATPRGGKENYKKLGINLIRSLNVHNDYFDYNDLAFIDDKQAEELSNVAIEENDVLLNITGASVARSCIVPKNLLPARVNQHVSIIRPERNANLNPIFLSRLFTNENYQNFLIKNATSKGATREAITKEQIEKLKIPVPPIELLNKFGWIVEKTEQIKADYKQSLQELENLYGSLSKDAFGG